MKFALLSVAAFAFAGCASNDVSRHPANPQIQREITQIIDSVRVETGTPLFSDLRRLVAYDVFAVDQVSKLAEEPNARLRSNALWVLAQIRDIERPDVNEHIEKVLRAGLKDDDPTVALEAASGLASRGRWDVLALLIDGLDNSDSSIRYRCHEQLVSTTSKDFGFQVDGSEESRHVAVTRWREWYAGWQRTHS